MDIDDRGGARHRQQPEQTKIRGNKLANSSETDASATTSQRVNSAGARAILDAAVDAFSERGYHGTSVRDIAERVRMSSAALYHHFSSKHDILVTLMEQGIDDLIRNSEEVVFSHGGDPVAALTALVRVHVLAHTKSQQGSLVSNAELRSLDPSSRALIVTKRDQQQRLFERLVTAGAEQQIFTTPYPLEASRAIVTMCTAVAGWYRKDGPLSPAEIADTYAVLALSLVGYDTDARSIDASVSW